MRGKPQTLYANRLGQFVLFGQIVGQKRRKLVSGQRNIAMPEVLLSHGAASVPGQVRRPSRQAAESDSPVATAVESGS